MILGSDMVSVPKHQYHQTLLVFCCIVRMPDQDATFLYVPLLYSKLSSNKSLSNIRFELTDQQIHPYNEKEQE